MTVGVRVAPLLAIFASAPAAAEPAPVSLTIDPCLGADAAAVRRVAAVELGTRLDDRGTAPVDVTRVAVRCEGAEVVVIVDDPTTGKTLRRALDLASQPREARVRLLGLAIAEAVVASWIELEVTPVPAVPVPAAVASPEVRREVGRLVRERLAARTPGEGAGSSLGSTSARATWSLSIGAERRAFRSLLLAGVAVRVARRLGPRAALVVDGVVETGAREVDGGEAEALSGSIAPLVAVETAVRGLRFEAALGARVGFVRFAGHSADTLIQSRSFGAPWGGPVVGVGARATPLNHLSITAGAEAGFALAGAIARDPAGKPAIAFDGVWVAFLVAVGVEL